MFLCGKRSTTARLGDTEQAWLLIETRLAPLQPSARTLTSAEWWIVTTETKRISERLEAKDPVGAVQVIDRTLAHLNDIALREFLEGRRGQIREFYNLP